MGFLGYGIAGDSVLQAYPLFLIAPVSTRAHLLGASSLGVAFG